jgi:hypothetical protein
VDHIQYEEEEEEEGEEIKWKNLKKKNCRGTRVWE